MDRREAYYVDILQAIGDIEDFLAQGRVTTLPEYSRHAMVRSAVEREAVNHIRRIDSEHPIREADRIVAFRNRLIHSYDAIDDHFVWSILRDHLPVLKRIVQEALGPGQGEYL
jgi:uncharacterized protein with HEPN domain